MEKTKSKSFDFGKKGWIVIILAFLSAYAFSALMNDSLNITLGQFAATRGLNQTVLFSFASIGTVAGVIASVGWGKLMHEKSATMVWGVASIVVGVFAIVWGNASSYAVYLIGFLVCQAGVVGSAAIGSSAVMNYWFPKKRGLAMGLVTTGFPLSAATTSILCNVIVQKLGLSGFYYVMAALHILIAVIVLVFVKDFPEQKGAFPDNDRNFDRAEADREFEAGMEYLKTSKWTIGKVFKTKQTWQCVFGTGILSFLAMGIMTNFINKFAEQGYALPQIFGMLAIAGILAIPGSIFLGWLDIKIGTRKACILTYVLGITAIAFNLTRIHVLHYISLPFLALMLGGSSNFQVATVNAIWGRYDFQNAFRVIQPFGTVLGGVGISVVGVFGTGINYTAAYAAVLVMAIIGLVIFMTLKLEPIDEDVRRVAENRLRKS